MITVTVPPTAAGQRIDVFSTDSKIESVETRSMAQKLIANGHVTIGGKPVSKSYKVAEGDVITYTLPEPKPCETAAEDIPLDIIYEDDSLLVINKPRGLVVHPAAGNWDGTLVNALMHHCEGKLSGIGGVLRPGIVHRLDKDTSGIMVVAKNDTAHQGLAAQLADKTMWREYNAICCGTLERDKLKIDAPIGRHPVNRKKMAVLTTATGQKVRNAITYIEVLERFEKKYTLVSARLETGRTHQIRVQMAHVGHPVLGDVTYGGASPAFLQEPGQVLHAMHLGFTHPVSGETMEFTAPWPQWFKSAVASVALL